MPPPPPPPPPPLSSGGGPPPKTQSRAMLLNEIHQGTQLKKTVTNDRSAPVIEGQKNSSASSSDMSRGPVSSFSGSLPKPTNIGGGGIAALFANGIPRKPSEAKGMAARKDKSVVGTEFTSVPKPPQLKPVGQQPNMPKPNSALKLAAPIVANKSVTSIATPLQPQSIKSKMSLPAASANSTAMTVASVSGTINKPLLPPTPQQHAAACAYKPVNIGAIQSASSTSRGPPKSEFMRPSSSHSSADQQSVRTESSEDIPHYKSIKRPAAPPPPPPGKSPSNVGPPPPHTLQQPPRPGFSGANHPPPPSVPINGLESAGPPQPPPRVSSYMESIEQRFHFLPTSELPPPPRFIGFQKFY